MMAASSSSLGREEALEDDHVIGAKRRRQDQGPGRIQQPQLLDVQIDRDGAAGEIHGKQGQEVEEFLSPQAALAQGVGHQDGQQHGQCRVAHRDHHREAHAPHHGGVRENRLIGRRFHLHRPEGNLAAQNGGLGGQGGSSHVDKGQQAAHADQNHDCHQDDLRTGPDGLFLFRDAAYRQRFFLAHLLRLLTRFRLRRDVWSPGSPRRT